MVTITGNASANTAPVVSAPLTMHCSEDAGRVGINLLEGASDAEGSPLVITGFKRTGGSASGYSVKNGVLTIDTAQFNKLKHGEELTLTFTYLVSDGKLKTTQTLSMVIVGANDAPVVKSALRASASEDAAPLSVNLLSGASDADGDALSVVSVVQSGGGQRGFPRRRWGFAA